MDQHQTVEIVGSVAAVHYVLMSNPSDNLLAGLRHCQLWG
jgi:UDP-N-acetylglucosamine transferase subunit ALG13